jgi:hypothetical protein
MSVIGRWLGKLARPAEEIRAENLRKWISSYPDVMPIDQTVARRRCRVAGVIQNIRIDPRRGSGSIEATIADGTGQMVAKWLGRPALSGIALGMGLIMEGTPGVGEHGELLVLNPEYELVPGPEHG